jgi:hypothetical protein
MVVLVSLDILCHVTEGETVNYIQLKSHGELTLDYFGNFKTSLC